MFGPVPHSGIGKDESSSIIRNIENSEGYAKVVRLTDIQEQRRWFLST